MKIKSFRVIPVLLFLLILPNIVPAGERKPTATVKELLTAISMIKNDSANKLTAEEIKNNKNLTKKASSSIYIEILGPKTLGSHWKKRTEKEKEAFLSLLTRLFENVAYPKSSNFFSDLKISYNSETIKENKAEVQTSMEHETEGLIEIDFKLRKVRGEWLINDVILDGVSLVTNLRTQFHRVISEESFLELTNRMNKRLIKEN